MFSYIAHTSKPPHLRQLLIRPLTSSRRQYPPPLTQKKAFHLIIYFSFPVLSFFNERRPLGRSFKKVKKKSGRENKRNKLSSIAVSQTDTPYTRASNIGERRGSFPQEKQKIKHYLPPPPSKKKIWKKMRVRYL